MGWLTSLLQGGGDEVGWDDLVTRAVDTIATLAHYGARGEVIFAAEVSVTLAVPERSVEVVRGFVDDPRFDREIGAALANRCDVTASLLPLRDYVVTVGDRPGVSVAEQAPRPWELAVEGGDLAGRILVLPGGATQLAFGRGEWHGGEGQVRNDLVVCERTSFVSRRAGSLQRSGHLLEVAALDQGDLLLVRRSSGEVVRPARTASGRVVVHPGDAIELADGLGDGVRLIVRRGPAG
jgi:hypothetical protein